MTSTETERFIDASIGLLALSRASRETAKQSLAYSKKVPTGIYSLQVVLSLLESSLEKTQHSAIEGKLDGNTCTRLLPEIQSCQSKIEELHANLVQLMRSIKFWSFRNFFGSKTAGTEKKQLKSLAEDIMRYHLQMAQAGAKCPSGTEILSITASTGIRLDYYLEYMISQLMVCVKCASDSVSWSKKTDPTSRKCKSCLPYLHLHPRNAYLSYQRMSLRRCR